MVHLVVESAFGVTQGFWGRVDAGSNPGVIAEQANRIGGPNKYAAFGPDLSALALAEILANCGWLMEGSVAESLHDQIAVTCREVGLEPPALLSAERTAKVHDRLRDLAARWRILKPKGAITLVFDPVDPVRSFDHSPSAS
jgi:hypothetical protein